MSIEFDHLIAFVSEQAIDAISVLFDARFQINRVTLVGLPRDMHKAASIAQAIQRRLKLHEKVVIENLPNPHEPTSFGEAFQRILRNSAGSPAINLNTDDAICACLALRAADELDTPVFAVETQSDRLVWLSAAHRSLPVLDVDDTLRTMDFFALHGFEYLGNTPVQNYANKLTCAQELLQIAISDESILQRFIPRTGLIPLITPDTTTLADLLAASGMLVDSPRRRLQFANFDALAFVRGGWLELAVYDELTGLAKQFGIVDSHRSLCVRHRDSRLVCEFDIALALRNELHIIECKSGDSRGGKFLSHFEGMSRAHGLRAKTLLVSVDALSETLVAMAEGMGIGCIHGKQLASLRQHLSTWLLA